MGAYEDSMTFTVRRWMGWSEAREKKVTVDLVDGLNEVVVEL